MKLFQRIFFAAVLAGFAAGLVLASLQQWRVVPLILVAETYETAEAAPAHEHASGDHASNEGAAAAHDHDHDASAWAPADGFERTAYTVLATTLASLGFALMVVAVATLVGLPITVGNGAIWGLGGFIAFQLAPALGLPPELPGMAAAELGLRQVWWWGTALSAGAGMLLMAKFRNLSAVAAGIALLVAPHLIGAPQLAGEHGSAVPAGLATAFAANTLGIGAAFWLVLCPLIGWFDARLAKSTAFAFNGAPA